MELPTSLRCLFSGRVEERDGTYVVEVPRSEVDLGTLRAGEVYRVGVLGEAEGDGGGASASTPTRSATGTTTPVGGDDGPPVEEGEVRQVEIEDVGDQGDGLARVGPGYVVFVSGASVGDRPTVRITSARENVAFAEIVE
jgi:predicted RNA-binding protein with TRAM domain